jgi:hypothetical protein
MFKHLFHKNKKYNIFHRKWDTHAVMVAIIIDAAAPGNVKKNVL